ncbi:unnamed protein product [Moneuplotes crassus]|uniref:Uncharacterized protein n=1 Tax=Euplotes crassus TaxID=5936 RepID=A0AAD2CWL6_EUPCR|nr:unnamed protein product [Moneuplotes crassus]
MEAKRTGKKTSPKTMYNSGYSLSYFNHLPHNEAKILSMHIENLTKSQKKKVVDEPYIFRFSYLDQSEAIAKRTIEEKKDPSIRLGEGLITKMNRCLESALKSYAILDFSGMSIPVKQLIKHLSKLKSICILDISYNVRLFKKEPRVKYFNRFLRRIFLAKCQKTLKKLSIAKSGMTEELAYNFCRCLPRMKTLQKLDISGNLIGEKAALTLAQYLENDEVLLGLDISANKIGDIGGKAILEALQENPALVDLNLSLNDMTSSMSKSIYQLIKLNKKLKRINFSFNKLENEGLKSILDSLSYNENLKCINLAGNEITSDGFKYLLKFQQSMYGFSLLKLNLYLNEPDKDQKKVLSSKFQDLETKILF